MATQECRHCKSEIPGDATRCAQCGLDPMKHEHMQSSQTLILLFVLIVAFGGVAWWWSQYA